MSTSVCIIICTRDRAAQIPNLLECLRALTVPPDLQCRACIVDNGSHDDTPSVLAAARLTNMPLKVVTCPSGGKSCALNMGVKTNEADIYLFTDDDVRPPVDWIQKMIDPFESGEADCVAGGLRALQQYDQLCEDRRLCMCLGDTRHKGTRDNDMMVGGNMAISAKVFNQIGGFNERLGAGALGSCEESLFSMQAVKAGFRIANRCAVIAEHHFDPSRMETRNLRRRSYREGLSSGYLIYHWQRQFISKPKQKFRDAVAHLQTWRRRNEGEITRTIGINPTEVDLLINAGMLRQYIRESKQPRLYPFEASGAVRI